MACNTPNTSGLINASGIPQACADQQTLNRTLTIAFTLIGAIALLMMVISGFRYVLSQGDPQKTAEIRRQIIYIAVGLFIVATADIIVNFILGKAG